MYQSGKRTNELTAFSGHIKYENRGTFWSLPRKISEPIASKHPIIKHKKEAFYVTFNTKLLCFHHSKERTSHLKSY